MTRKLLMITTAIVALGAAPAVFAQGAPPASTRTAGGQAQPGATNTGMKPAPATTQTQSATVPTQAATSSQSMVQHKAKKAHVKSSAKKPNKAIHAANVSGKHGKSSYREMNKREVEMTRTLNREAIKGGNPQSAMAPTPMSTPATGNMGMNPATSAGAGGTPNSGAQAPSNR